MGSASLIDALVAEAPVLTDGAWGTQMQARGLALGEIPDSWNLTHADRVEAVARAYVDAGSRVILTNTFRANRIALERHEERHQIAAINRAGVEISRRAAAGRARVFASIGPTGKMLLMKQVTEADIESAFREQAEAQAAAGADALVVETMADLAEARIAVRAACTTGLPVVACMVFDSGANRDRTMMGDTPEQAARELGAAGASVIGANCGMGPEQSLPICRALSAATGLPIWIKPNAGLPETIGEKTVYRTTPEEFASFLPRWIEAGVSFVGGCCGTSPEFIRALGDRARECARQRGVR
jgi:methionine synthase I (cobalamin-dependent)